MRVLATHTKKFSSAPPLLGSMVRLSVEFLKSELNSYSVYEF
jgi:hypothetical protein